MKTHSLSWYCRKSFSGRGAGGLEFTHFYPDSPKWKYPAPTSGHPGSQVLWKSPCTIYAERETGTP